MRRAGWLVLIILTVVLALGPTSYADTQPKNRGLYITPLREYIQVAAGHEQHKTLTIANITDKPVTVTLSVEQFSVEDYTYDYKFGPIKENWIKFQTTQLQLQPNKSRDITYAVTVPPGATPGGHYFTLFATTSLDGGVNDKKVRAATVLYVTVDGQLNRTSRIQKETIPWISFGGDIPFALDIRNTGNTHFFINVSGTLNGWTAKSDVKEVTHILIPGTARNASSTIAAPLLPGVYEATYGYKVDDGTVVTRSKHIVYAPLWSVFVPLGVVWLTVVLWRHRKNAPRTSHATDSSQQPYK